MELEELVKKIDTNLEKINKNAEKIETNFKQIQNNSFALDILKDYKNESTKLYSENSKLHDVIKRLFWVIIIIVGLWFATGVYLVYVLNDTSNIETSEDVTEIDGVETIDNSHIKIGDDIWEKSK